MTAVFRGAVDALGAHCAAQAEAHFPFAAHLDAIESVLPISTDAPGAG
jgi:hypothetical protein